MAHLHLHKVVFILTLLFLVADAKHKIKKHKVKDPYESRIKRVPPHLPFLPFPFMHEQPSDDDQTQSNYVYNPSPSQDENMGEVDDDVYDPNQIRVSKPDFETASIGSWEIISQESGVSAMQINLMPTNKIIVYDALVYRTSRIKLPDGVPCLPYKDFKTNEDKLDCFAHSVEYDIETNQVRPLKISRGDPWCSCGGLAPDGSLVSAGGFFDGEKTVRYIGGNCQGDCEWREYNNVMKDPRWYASQQILPNGDFVVVGGRRAFSYEFLPKEGQNNEKPYFFPFLYETSDLDENNLYPFVHLSTDGNLFVFSNNRSLLLNPSTNKIVRLFPVLPGGSRNYPASGMSALLPINLNGPENESIKAEVIVCGGNVPTAFESAELKKIFLPALQDCNRLTITDPNPEWDTEDMPSKRTMGDSLILPNGQLLFINGAQRGTAAWWDADEPNYTPVLYNPDKPKGERFKVLKGSQVARMYHSTSAVLPSGKIWVAGSNTHDTYKDKDKYPTETRVEAFSPPYLDENVAKYRPQIDEHASVTDLRYGAFFELQFLVQDTDGGVLSKRGIKVTMYFPPFTTHGVSMSQRLVVLKSYSLVQQGKGLYRIRLVAPPSGVIAPPGYYTLFVVHRGVPSKGIWVHIQ